MRKKIYSLVAMLLIGVMFISVFPAEKTEATQKSKYLKVSEFDQMLMDVVSSDDSINNETFSENAYVTNEIAAVLVERTDELLNGDSYDTTLYQQVLSKNRISDIKKAEKANRKSIRLVFTKGLMLGKSNGNYTQNRAFQPTSKMNRTAVTTLLTRLKNKSKRFELSPDGQAIRTVNLPKNYKRYPYILASFPNKFYEAAFDFEDCTGDPLVMYENYAYPSGVNKCYLGENSIKVVRNAYSDQWCKTIKKNLTLRFNFNYRTTDVTTWANSLADTFMNNNSAEDRATRVKTFKNYANNYAIKKYQARVQSSKIVVEPSTLYKNAGGWYCIRCYVRFKATAKWMPTANSQDQNGIIFGDPTYFPGLKNGKWYSAIIDVPIYGWGRYDDGSRWRVYRYGIGYAGY